jgi:hypothetical protein
VKLFRPGIIGCVGAARLHGVGDLAVVDELQPGDVVGAGERLVSRLLVAELPVDAQIVRRLVMELRLALVERLGRVDAGLERPVLDLHQLSSALGLGRRLRDHHGDEIAHEAHLVVDEGGARRRVLGPGAGTNPHGTPPTPSFLKSSPVSTATTPGAVAACFASILSMVAWACGERTKQA